MVDIQVNNHNLPMEVDTGAAVSVVPFTACQKYLSKTPLKDSPLLLTTYTTPQIELAGMIEDL